MSFLAYAASDGCIKIDYTTRDEATGIIGSLASPPAPVATADDRDSITEKAYAHLGRNPSDLVYIADTDGLLFEIIINHAYSNERELQGKWHFIAWSLLVMCLVCFVATLLLGLGFKGLLLFAGITGLYLMVVQTGIQNEVKAAVVCLIILLLVCTLVPALRGVRSQLHKLEPRTNHPMQPSGEVARFEVEDQPSPPADR
ncbi:hypothetical protein [Roseiconus lacunae]|uniref:Uncharacterized protein n=1 Tax=Roseiconus lacunae TaxID=2605694 RepID=A0ABT7PST5_9BACT|nr:hypothetical protein [Roseiconus lacunae]MDM4019554.1 hypothetical protein [Roseiconus lacunae]